MTAPTVHLRDSRRAIGFAPWKRQPTQIPVICAADVIDLEDDGQAFTERPGEATCPDCRERIEATS